MSKTIKSSRMLAALALTVCLLGLQANAAQAAEIPCNGCCTRIAVFNPVSPEYATFMLGTDGMVFRVCQVTPGPNQQVYTIHWCLCNEPEQGDHCYYAYTTSSDPDDDGKTYEDYGCHFDDGIPPSTSTCKLRWQGVGCRQTINP
jgi:hypothetical protein